MIRPAEFTSTGSDHMEFVKNRYADANVQSFRQSRIVFALVSISSA